MLAWVLAMVLLPVVDGLERRRLSRALTSIVLVILLIASIMVIVGVLTVPLTYWLRRGSELGALLKEREQACSRPLHDQNPINYWLENGVEQMNRGR